MFEKFRLGERMRKVHMRSQDLKKDIGSAFRTKVKRDPWKSASREDREACMRILEFQRGAFAELRKLADHAREREPSESGAGAKKYVYLQLKQGSYFLELLDDNLERQQTCLRRWPGASSQEYRDLLRGELDCYRRLKALLRENAYLHRIDNEDVAESVVALVASLVMLYLFSDTDGEIRDFFFRDITTCLAMTLGPFAAAKAALGKMQLCERIADKFIYHDARPLEDSYVFD